MEAHRASDGQLLTLKAEVERLKGAAELAQKEAVEAQERVEEVEREREIAMEKLEEAEREVEVLQEARRDLEGKEKSLQEVRRSGVGYMRTRLTDKPWADGGNSYC